MPATALRVSQLLTVSAASVDPELAAFKFRRVVPVAIYVDAGKQSRRLGRKIARDANAILKELGYGDAVEWGTFEGSFIQLNIRKGGVPEDEPTFLDKMLQARDRIAEKAADKLKTFPWKKAGKVAVNGVKVAVAVGGLVTLIGAGPASPLVVGMFVLPAKAWFTVEAAGKTVEVFEGIRDMLVASPPAVQALHQATSPIPTPSPPPTPDDEASQREVTKKNLAKLAKRRKQAPESFKLRKS